MPGYWLGIMAAGLAIALAIWITLVMRADRQVPDKPPERPPPREIVGGVFEASRGGRQVMPDPNEPIVHDTRGTAAEQPPPAGSGQTPEATVPEQRNERQPDQRPASGNRT